MTQYEIKALPGSIYRKNEETGDLEKLELEIGDSIELSDEAAKHLMLEGFIETPEKEE